MFREIAVGFMLSFLCFVQLSCCSVNKYKSSNDIYVSYLNKKFNKSKGNVSNQNFIFLAKYVLTKNHNDFTKVCYKGEDNYDECHDPLTPINSASGYVVKVDKDKAKIYAITAAHWCEEISKEELYDSTELLFDKMPLIGYYATFMGNQYRINSYVLDYTSDLCLVTFNSRYYKYAKEVRIGKDDPNIGDPVYALSAPMWSHDPELRQHYTGKSSGCDDFECAFTIPATYGSSGSAVINEKGEIISVISRAAVGFNNYAIGAKPQQIREFLEKSYETLRR